MRIPQILLAGLTGFCGGLIGISVGVLQIGDEGGISDEVKTRKLLIVNDKDEVVGWFMSGDAKSGHVILRLGSESSEGKHPNIQLSTIDTEFAYGASITFAASEGPEINSHATMGANGSGAGVTLFSRSDSTNHHVVNLKAGVPDSGSILTSETPAQQKAWPGIPK